MFNCGAKVCDCGAAEVTAGIEESVLGRVATTVRVVDVGGSEAAA